MNVDPVIQFEVSQPNELDFSAGSERSLRTTGLSQEIFS